jgi:hypothetical protein
VKDEVSFEPVPENVWVSQDAPVETDVAEGRLGALSGPPVVARELSPKLGIFTATTTTSITRTKIHEIVPS